MTNIETVRKSNRRILAFVMALLLCLTLLPDAALAANTSATTMSLLDWEGENNATVKTSSGTSKTVRKGMTLYSGYTVTTGSGGKAWIALDGSKTITLSASSSVEVRSSGGKLDVLLNAGELNFSSDGPVGAGKNYNVVTQTAVCGIIGSFGWANPREIGLVHGNANVTCTNPITGETGTTHLGNGEGVSFVGNSAQTGGQGDAGTDTALEKIGFEKSTLQNEDIPASTVEEILADPEKQMQVAEVDSLDLQVLSDTLEDKRAAEADAAAAAQAGAQAAAAAQEKQIAAEAGAAITVPEGGGVTVGGDVTVGGGDSEGGGVVGTEEGGKVLDLWDAEGHDIAAAFEEPDDNAGTTTTDDSGATTGGESGEGESGEGDDSGEGGDSGGGSSGGGTTTEEEHGYLSVIIPTGVGQTVDVALKRGTTVISQYVEGSESATYAVHSGEALTLSLGTLPSGWEWNVSAAMWITGGPEEGITAAVEGTGNTRTITVPTIGDSDVLESFIVNVGAEQSTQTQTYGITIDSSIAHGTVTATLDGVHPATSAEAGNSVILGFTPDEGYEISAVSVVPDGGGEVETSAISDNGCTFTMPAKPVTVYANFTAVRYAVTVTQPENGSLSADKETAAAGETVTLTVTPATDYVLDTLTVTAADSSTVTVSGNNTFTMPAQAVTVAATFKAVTYDVTVTTPTNGTVTADKAAAAAGETVTLTVTPNTDYLLDTLTVTGADNSTVTVNSSNNSFTMPAQAVTVTATFRAMGTVATPTFGTTDTTFETAFTLSLECATEGASIYYTTNGDTPTSASTPYPTDGIQITGTTTVKAIAVKDGMLASAVAEKTFTRIYRVTVTATQNGTVTSGIDDGQTAELFAEGNTVVLTVTPDTDYLLDTLTVTAADNSTVTVSGNNTFTMPAQAVTVAATFKQKQTVATPTFGTTDTTFEETLSLSLSCDTEGASIYYTTNGDTPTSTSTLYTAPFGLTETTTVKAVAIKDGMLDSAVATATYTKTVAPTEVWTVSLEYSAATDRLTVAHVDPSTLSIDDVRLTYDEDSGTYTVSAADPAAKPLTFEHCGLGQYSTYGEYTNRVNASSYESVTFQFTPGLRIVIMTRDGSTYQYFEGATVELTRPDGQKITKQTNTENGTPPSAYFEGLDYPTGTYSYTITANGYQAKTGTVVRSDLGSVLWETVDMTPTPTYAVTVTQPENGTVTANPASAAAGETVTLTVTPDTSYELATLTVTGADNSAVTVNNNNTFTMPAQAVTVTATFVHVYNVAITMLHEDICGTMTVMINGTPVENGGAISIRQGDPVLVAVEVEKNLVNCYSSDISWNGSAIPQEKSTDHTSNTYTFGMSNGGLPTSTFTMPGKDVTLTVEGLQLYSLTYDPETTNGGISKLLGIDVTQYASYFPVYSQRNANIDVVVQPASGYTAAKVLAVPTDDAPQGSAEIEVQPVANEENTYRFHMPAYPVVVTATFESTAPATYSIGIDEYMYGGTAAVTVNGQTATSAAVGETVYVTVTPDEGFEVSTATDYPVHFKYQTDPNDDYSWCLTNAEKVAGTENQYSFVMPGPAYNGAVYASFARTPTAVTSVLMQYSGGTLSVAQVKPETVAAADLALSYDAGTQTYTLAASEGKALSFADCTLNNYNSCGTYTNKTVAQDGKSVSFGFTPEYGFLFIVSDAAGAAAGATVTLTLPDGTTAEMATAISQSGNQSAAPFSGTQYTDGEYTYTIVKDSEGASGSVTLTSSDLGVRKQVTVTLTQLYTVTCATAENGAVTADKQTAAAGETVTLTVTPDTGYALTKLTVKAADNSVVTVSGTAFTMPAQAVTVYATFARETVGVKQAFLQYNKDDESFTVHSAKNSNNEAMDASTLAVTKNGSVYTLAAAAGSDAPLSFSNCSIYGYATNGEFTDKTPSADGSSLSFGFTPLCGVQIATEDTAHEKIANASVTVTPPNGTATTLTTNENGMTSAFTGANYLPGTYTFSATDGTDTVTGSFILTQDDLGGRSKLVTVMIGAAHTVTLEYNSAYGTVVSNRTAAAAGDIIELTATPNAGVTLGSARYTKPDGSTISPSFTNGVATMGMPDYDVVIHVEFGYAITGLNAVDELANVLLNVNGTPVSFSDGQAIIEPGAQVELRLEPEAAYRTANTSEIPYYPTATVGSVAPAYEFYVGDDPYNAAGYSYCYKTYFRFTMPAQSMALANVAMVQGYVFTFDNGQSGDALRQTQTAVPYDGTYAAQTFTLPACSFEQPGNEPFAGWMTTMHGDAQTYAQGAAYPLGGIDLAQVVDNGGFGFHAVWAEPTYAVTVTQPTNGTVEADMETASEGVTVTLTVVPDPNYELGALTVTYGNGLTVEATQASGDDSTWTFEMPAQPVTVTATFTARSYTLHVPASFDGGTLMQVQIGDTVLSALSDDGDYTVPAGESVFLTVRSAQTETMPPRTYPSGLSLTVTGTDTAADAEVRFDDIMLKTQGDYPEKYAYETVFWLTMPAQDITADAQFGELETSSVMASSGDDGAFNGLMLAVCNSGTRTDLARKRYTGGIETVTLDFAAIPGKNAYVWVTVPSDNNYYTDLYTVTDVAVYDSDDNQIACTQYSNYAAWKFTMPSEGGVLVYVTLEKAQYAVTIPTFQNGAVTATVDGEEVTQAAVGETVTLTPAPESGYVLESLRYTPAGRSEVTLEKGADGSYTFLMPSAAVTVSATFVEGSAAVHTITIPADYAELVSGVKKGAQSVALNGEAGMDQTFEVEAGESYTVTFATPPTTTPPPMQYVSAVGWTVTDGGAAVDDVTATLRTAQKTQTISSDETAYFAETTCTFLAGDADWTLTPTVSAMEESHVQISGDGYPLSVTVRNGDGLTLLDRSYQSQSDYEADADIIDGVAFMAFPGEELEIEVKADGCKVILEKRFAYNVRSEDGFLTFTMDDDDAQIAATVNRLHAISTQLENGYLAQAVIGGTTYDAQAVSEMEILAAATGETVQLQYFSANDSTIEVYGLEAENWSYKKREPKENGVLTTCEFTMAEEDVFVSETALRTCTFTSELTGAQYGFSKIQSPDGASVTNDGGCFVAPNEMVQFWLHGKGASFGTAVLLNGESLELTNCNWLVSYATQSDAGDLYGDYMMPDVLPDTMAFEAVYATGRRIAVNTNMTSQGDTRFLSVGDNKQLLETNNGQTAYFYCTEDEALRVSFEGRTSYGYTAFNAFRALGSSGAEMTLDWSTDSDGKIIAIADIRPTKDDSTIYSYFASVTSNSPALYKVTVGQDDVSSLRMVRVVSGDDDTVAYTLAEPENGSEQFCYVRPGDIVEVSSTVGGATLEYADATGTATTIEDDRFAMPQGAVTVRFQAAGSGG